MCVSEKSNKRSENVKTGRERPSGRWRQVPKVKRHRAEIRIWTASRKDPLNIKARWHAVTVSFHATATSCLKEQRVEEQCQYKSGVCAKALCLIPPRHVRRCHPYVKRIHFLCCSATGPYRNSRLQRCTRGSHFLWYLSNGSRGEKETTLFIECFHCWEIKLLKHRLTFSTNISFHSRLNWENGLKRLWIFATTKSLEGFQPIDTTVGPFRQLASLSASSTFISSLFHPEIFVFFNFFSLPLFPAVFSHGLTWAFSKSSVRGKVRRYSIWELKYGDGDFRIKNDLDVKAHRSQSDDSEMTQSSFHFFCSGKSYVRHHFLTGADDTIAAVSPPSQWSGWASGAWQQDDVMWCTAQGLQPLICLPTQLEKKQTRDHDHALMEGCGKRDGNERGDCFLDHTASLQPYGGF